MELQHDGEFNFYLYPTIIVFFLNEKSAWSIQEYKKYHFIKTCHDLFPYLNRSTSYSGNELQLQNMHWKRMVILTIVFFFLFQALFVINEKVWKFVIRWDNKDLNFLTEPIIVFLLWYDICKKKINISLEIVKR